MDCANDQEKAAAYMSIADLRRSVQVHDWLQTSERVKRKPSIHAVNAQRPLEVGTFTRVATYDKQIFSLVFHIITRESTETHEQTGPTIDISTYPLVPVDTEQDAYIWLQDGSGQVFEPQHTPDRAHAGILLDETRKQ